MICGKKYKSEKEIRFVVTEAGVWMEWVGELDKGGPKRYKLT